MKLLLTFCVIFIVINVHSANERIDPIVQIDQGLVRGLRATEGSYSYFLGVPFARVNFSNPFGPAQPPPTFGSEVFYANNDSKICPQFPIKGRGHHEANKEETFDCLRLNIYVPDEASSKNLLPVFFWIHGGTFAGGYGAKYNPRILVQQGIVVVTVNYRLGPYGFMCLDTPMLPGNQGLKDQHEALRWVKSNIAAFGGKPDDVTIGGQSAGSSSTLLHLYSPKEKLFSKVVAESGTPQSEGMFVESDLDAAKKIAGYLGFNTTNTDEALEFLSKETFETVNNAASDLELVLRPCREKSFSGIENFFVTYPFSISNPTKVKDTPILIGHTSQEEYGLKPYPKDYLTKNPFFDRLKTNFNFNDELLTETSTMVRHFYIGDEEISKNVTFELADFESDLLINYPVQRIITNLLKEHAGPVYEYVFSYVGDSGGTAVGHMAELPYLFDTDRTVADNDDNKLLTARMTTLWANFVKHGNADSTIRVMNEHVLKLEADVLYHLGLDTLNYDLPALFGDVKFVCMGGTKYRMRDFAAHIAEVLNIPQDGKLVNLTKHSHRYAMYKVGPVLSVSHGIGIPSMTILLQEVIKLMFYAKAKDPIFFRIGTSGGLKIPPGSVVVSAWGLNGTLEKSYDIPVLGKVRKLPAYFDERLAQEVLSLASEHDGFQTHIGGTLAADDFYRGQARLDGPVCDYTEADKLTFLNRLSELGVKNIEMEATAFAAYTREVGVRASDVCVTLLNRLEGDQVTPSKETMLEWQKRPMTVVGRYVKKYYLSK